MFRGAHREQTRTLVAPVGKRVAVIGAGWPGAVTAELPARPSGQDFETFVTSLTGPRLYSLLIWEYTAKQCGRSATELSGGFALKRVELRDEGHRRLFRDTWEFFPANGMNRVIDSVLSPCR